MKSERLRVAVILGVLFPETLAVWRACGQAGTDVTLIGTTSNLFGKWPWTPGQPHDIPCVRLRSITPSIGPRMQLWLVYRGLARTLAQLRPDIIHIYTEPWGGRVLQTLLSRSVRSSTARVSIHAAETIYKQGSTLERSARAAIVGRVFRRIDGFASWSQQGIDAARRSGLPDVPTVVCPGIVPDPAVVGPIRALERHPLRAEFGLPHDVPILGYIGRLVEEKGIRDLLAALRRLESREERPFLAVWGSGPLEGLVRSYLGSDARRGRFGGVLPLAAVPRAFRACDAMVLPSRTTATWEEQFGRVILEAMLVECPAVAYRSGAIPEAVGKGGVLVDEGDIDGLASAISLVMGNAGLRADLAVKGLAHAAAFDPAALAAKLNSFWSEMVRAPSVR